MTVSKGNSRRRSAAPLWQQVQRDLARRLADAEFVNDFPGELVLADEYGVSRQTIRAALRPLREQGLVTAARGRRSKPAEPPEIEQPLGALYSLFASVEAAGEAQDNVVRCLQIRADAIAADRLGRESSTPLVYLERLRLAGGEPLAVDRVWLPADVAAPLLDADFRRTSLYAELAARCGVRLDGGEEHLQARVPGRAERVDLGITASVAVFAIDRLGSSRGAAVEWRQTLVRGDRFGVRARFDAREGYRLADVSHALPATGPAESPESRAE